jgi:hypothetical protein
MFTGCPLLLKYLKDENKCVWFVLVTTRGQVTTESMFLMAAAKGDRKHHPGKGIDA